MEKSLTSHPFEHSAAYDKNEKDEETPLAPAERTSKALQTTS